MTKEQIMQAGLKNFAEHGYEGASMAMIADTVGIKKQSIYTHFKNKDALFSAVCDACCDAEIAFIEETLRGDFKVLLEKYIVRYQSNEATKFWLRMMFFPPQHLYTPVMEKVYHYLGHIEQLATAAFEQADVTEALTAETIAKSYLAVLDSVFVELLYGDVARATERLEAIYTVFWRGIQK